MKKNFLCKLVCMFLVASLLFSEATPFLATQIDEQFENVETNAKGITPSNKRNAKEIKLNKKVIVEQQGKEAVYYKFSIKKQGYFILDFSPTTSSKLAQWNIKLYKDGTEIKNFYDKYESFQSSPLAMGKGTYYIMIEGNRWTEGYELKVNFKESTNWESEPNDQQSKADKISLNNTYKGVLIDNDDEDWFKFTLKKAGDINIYMNIDEDTDFDKIHYGWKLTLYKKGSSNEIETINVRENTTIKTALTAGTYFVKIENKSTSKHFSAVDAIYNLKVKYAKTPGKVTITKARVGNKKVTLEWKKTSNASDYYIYRSTSKNGTYKKIATISGTASLKYVDQKISSKKTYYYKIVAYNKTLNITGTESAIKSVKTK